MPRVNLTSVVLRLGEWLYEIYSKTYNIVKHTRLKYKGMSMRSNTSSGKPIEFHESPNRWRHNHRRVKPITSVVIHYTGSPDGLAGDIAWCLNPEAQVSYHYLVDGSGKIVQLVKEADRAWHAGVSSWNEQKHLNEFSLGVALDGVSGTKWTAEQLESLADLCYDIKKDYDLSLDDFVGHEDVSPGRKFDPGSSFDWEKFRRMLRKRVDASTLETIEIHTSADADGVEGHCCCPCRHKCLKTS